MFDRCPFTNVVLVALATALAGCDPDLQPTDESEPSHDLLQRVTELEDREAIRDVAACYGRGHDAIFGNRDAALEILGHCFAPDLHTEVYFFGAAEPTAELDTLEAFVAFIEQFALDNQYTHARNIVGDVGVELFGSSAVMMSATSTPHFIETPADLEDPALSVDFVTARYEDHLLRNEDGRWRTHTKLIHLDAFWRGVGTYPLSGS